MEGIFNGLCDWSINFNNWKKDSYNSILVIIDWLTKMVYYKSVKITIDAPELGKVIINVIIYDHRFSDSIITN